LLILLGYVPLISKGEELVGVDTHVSELLVVGGVVRERPEERVGALLCQNGMEFAVYGPALFVVQCQLALDDEAVNLRVGVSAEIVLPGPYLGGMEEGGYYVTREGYKIQFLEKLGFRDIYPGTLNLKIISEEAIKKRRKILEKKDLSIRINGFKNEDRTYGPVICYRCLINNKIEGALLEIERTHWEENVIEIISSVYLRDALKLKDGDLVKIKVFFLAFLRVSFSLKNPKKTVLIRTIMMVVATNILIK